MALYNCTFNVAISHWILMFYNQNITVIYPSSTGTKRALLYRSICYNENLSSQAKGTIYSAVNINPTNIGIIWQGPIQLLYGNINTNTQNLNITNTFQGFAIHQSPVATYISQKNILAVWSKREDPICNPVTISFFGQTSLYDIPSSCAYTIDLKITVSVEQDISLITWPQDTKSSNNGIDIYGYLFSNITLNTMSIFPINAYQFGEQKFPSSVNSEGIFGVAWGGVGKGLDKYNRYHVYIRFLNVNGTFVTDELQVNNITHGRISDIQIAATSGVFAVGWQVQNPVTFAREGMYAQLLYKNGTKLGKEFRINNVTEGAQKDLRIVTTDKGFIFGFLGSGDNAPYYGQTLIHIQELDITPYLESTEDEVNTPTYSLPRTSTVSKTKTLTQVKTPTILLNDTQQHTLTPTLTDLEKQPSSTVTLPMTHSNTMSVMTATATVIHTLTDSVTEVPEFVTTPATSQPPVEVERPTERKQGAASKTVVAGVQKTGSVASAVSIASASSTNVVLGSRIETASEITLCNIAKLTNSTLSGHSWTPNLGVLIGDYEVEDASNTLYTSLLLWSGIGGVAVGVSFLVPAYASFAIGAFILTDLFLSSTITSSAVTMIRFGSGFQPLAGFITISIMSLPVILGGVGVYSKYFKAEYVKGVWKHSPFVTRYGILFKEYTGVFRGWMAVEKAMTIATGSLEGMSINSECYTIIYWGTGIFSAHFLATAIFRPYISLETKLYNNPNLIFGGISFLQVVPFVLASFQAANPEYKDNEAINTVIEISPTIANIIVTAITLKDGIVCIKNKCWKTKIVQNMVDNDTSGPKLQVPVKQPVTPLADDLYSVPFINSADSRQPVTPLADVYSGPLNSADSHRHNPLQAPNCIINSGVDKEGFSWKTVQFLHGSATDHV